MRATLVLAPILVMSGCGGSLATPPGSDGGSTSTIVAGSGLATSCSTDDDCVGVYFGDVCGFCTTDQPNAAIASSAAAAYQNALNAAESSCPPLMGGGSCVGGSTITTCTGGTCTLTTCPGALASAHACASTDVGSTVVTPSDYATSCSTDDDCVAVYFGDVCGLCATDEPNDAIASSAETAYQNALNAALHSCPPVVGGVSCNTIPTITTCALGRCLLTACPGVEAASAHACASTNDAGVSASDGGSTIVAASGFATSCGTDDDCVGVHFGDVCGLCATDVPNAAIASSAETAYQDALNAAQSLCPPSTIAGSCVEDLTITTCAMGTCMLTTCPGAPTSAHACASTNDASASGSDAGTDDAD